MYTCQHSRFLKPITCQDKTSIFKSLCIRVCVYIELSYGPVQHNMLKLRGSLGKLTMGHHHHHHHLDYTAPIPPQISSGCCTAGVCGQCEWESKRGPVGQQRWFLCKAAGGLFCRSVFNGIRFSTKNRWQSKILKSSRCRGCIGPLMTGRDNGGRCMGSSNAYKGRRLAN